MSEGLCKKIAFDLVLFDGIRQFLLWNDKKIQQRRNVKSLLFVLVLLTNYCLLCKMRVDEGGIIV